MTMQAIGQVGMYGVTNTISLAYLATINANQGLNI